MPARARACCAAANAGVRPQALGGGRERWGARRAGAFLPFTSREDVDFFSHLEMHLRQEFPPLSGRDHLAYRSSYFPVRSPNPTAAPTSRCGAPTLPQLLLPGAKP
jgi:hypothetical protein